MLRQASRLLPFENDVPAGVLITAELIWNWDGWLELSYGILMPGPRGISDLVLPEPLLDGPQSNGHQRDGLWTTTCCEAFLAIPGENHYWEFNLAPNGDWAAYRFQDYRRGQHNQDLNAAPDIHLKRWHHQLRLDARLSLEPWWPNGQCPDLSITCVLQDQKRGLSHWALRHEGEEADFHCRRNFLRP